ncbi:choice-of-anchor Q domain-containing protein [Geminocystis sp. CENA526]|uniref:choice-of-anchor Q domain-containing protein n=1 Tax=Geminocystis sp. CENA526 TaxID=1355871 RepID=UPI003D6DC71A
MNTSLYDHLFQDLTDFANSDKFWTDFELIFGTNFNVTIAESIRHQWINGDFGDLPPIRVLETGMGSIFGAYAHSTNTIYLSQDFLNRATTQQIKAVLLEEIGHYVDSLINTEDSEGDEGEIFSALVSGVELNELQLQSLKTQNDHFSIVVDGQTLQVEAAIITVTNTNDSGPGSLRQAILDANALGGEDTIIFGGPIFTDTTPDTIILTSGPLTINESVNIKGTGANLLTISGNNNSRVFQLGGISANTYNLSGLTITGGIADLGGGIFMSDVDDSLNIDQVHVTGNTATSNGGGLYIQGGTLNFTNSTISNNNSVFDGGGTLVDTNATLSNVTVSSNTASEVGGIRHVVTNGSRSLLLINTTIANHTQTGNAGIGLANTSQNSGISAITKYSNSIFDNNTTNIVNANLDTGTGASIQSLGYNISSDGTGNLTATGDLPNTNPLLGVLQNNGGSTPTHALLPGSPAIGAGNTTLITDQRGITRPQGTNDDIGAFEYVLPTVNISATDAIATESGNTGTFQLTRTIPTGGSTDSLPVQLTLSGTASASDYNFSASGGTVNVSGNTVTVTFNSGSNTVDLTVTPVDDIQAEPDETVILTLDSSVNYDLGTNSSATVTILQNDFVVTNTNDSGEGSLRQAILNANAIAGANTITFDIAGSGVRTITLNSALPEITEQVTIDGTTQPDFTNSPIIEINGNNSVDNGLSLGGSSSNSVIKGLIINRFTYAGILINSTGNKIQKNYIGTTATGTSGAGNSFGVFVNLGNNNIIGSDEDGTNDASEGNLISGNGNVGVLLFGSNNVVRGNYIGTNVDGTSAIGNGIHGVYIGSSNHTIGGATATARNIISGNNFSGIAIFANVASGASNNIVQGNYIGTDVTGTQPLGNGSGSGIRITGANNTIGGTVAGEGNIIAYNSGNGVFVVDGFNANPSLNNAGNNISGNSIFNNTGLGIDIAINQDVNDINNQIGVTANDLLDLDTGVNNLQNYPLLTFNSIGQIIGSLNSTKNTTFRVEFFGNTTPDPTGYGEGQTFLGFKNVTTDDDGNATFTFNQGSAINVTATATDPGGNTSEFSRITAMVGVDGSSNLVITDVPGSNNDRFTLSSNGTSLILTDTNNRAITTVIPTATGDGTKSLNIPLTAFKGEIFVNTLGGNDILTIDFSNGNPLPTAGLTFNGGSQTSTIGDQLALTGGTFTTATYTYFNENDGKIDLDGSVINYTGLEPITSTITSDNVVLNYSTSAETITITAVNATQTNVDSTLGETTTFNNPSQSLTINGGVTGTNIFNLNSISSGFEADLNIKGSGYTNGDVLNINGDVTANDFSIDLVQNINIASGAVKTIDLLSDNGDVTWTVGQTIGLAFGSNLTSTKGNINLIAKGEITGIDYRGIVVDNSQIKSSEGSIKLNGTANGINNERYGVHVTNSGQVVSTDSATITIIGQGSLNGLGNGNDGVRVDSNGIVSSVSGSIDIHGTSGNGNNFNRGVWLEQKGQITTETGTITINGTAQSEGGANFGIAIMSGSKISATKIGKIILQGQGSLNATDASNDGVLIEGINGGVNSQVTAKDGSIEITGTGGGNGNNKDLNHGVRISDRALVQSTGEATIKITGFGGAQGQSSNYGLRIINQDTVITSVKGDITIEGTGRGSGGDNRGVSIESGGAISSTGLDANAAKITIAGKGSVDGTAGGNDGVRIDGTNSKISSIAGSIEITGTGGNGTTDNNGVHLVSTGQISSTGTGTNAATITITGQGSTTATGNNNDGIRLNNGIIQSVDGNITLTGTGGGTGTSGYGLRIINSSAKVESTGKATIDVTGFGSTTGTGSGYGIEVWGSSKITSVTGNIFVTGTGGGTGGNNFGVVVQNLGSITSTGIGVNAANINITGQGSTTATGNDNDGIRLNNGTIQSVDGNIILTGTGGGNGNNNIGVIINDSGQINSTGKATINIIGQGSVNGKGTTRGITLANKGSVTSNTGDITLKGTGKGVDNFNIGISLLNSSQINSTETAKINLIGIGSTTGTSNNWGVEFNDNSAITSADGNISIEGTGDGNGNNNLGVRISGGGQVKSTESATITVTGFGSENGVGTNHGIQMTGASSTITSKDGNITINGTGRGTGNDNRGVSIESGGVISSTGKATITVIGQGSVNPLSTGGNRGVRVDNGAQITSEKGAIFISGKAGATGESEEAKFNYGVQVVFSGEISSTGIGSDAATITIEGNGGSISSKANQNAGVDIEQGGKITSKDGAIKVSGSGGSGVNSNFGVLLLKNGGIFSTGTGQYASTITIIGQGSTSATGSFNTGVNINNSKVTSVDGDISITGTGGSGTEGNNGGISVVSSSQISASGDAHITLKGEGGEGTNSHGILLDNSKIESNSGNIILQGTANNSSVGINIISGASIVSSSGNITLKADTLNLEGDANSISSTSELLIIQETNNTSIGLGSGSGTLNLTASEILSFGDGFSKISIGNNKSGVIDIQNATFTDNLTLISGSNIIANGLTVTSADATILSEGVISEGTTGNDIDITANNVILSGTVKPGGVENTFGILNINGNVSFNTSDAIADILSFEIDDDITNFDRVAIIGTVNITGVTLNFNNSDITSGNITTSELIIIDNDDTDAIIGSFSNYGDGSLVTINDLTYILNYQGGDGNDVSLNLVESEITIDGNNNLVITDTLFTDTDDRWTISFDGTDIIVTDTNGNFLTTNIAGATGNNTSEIKIPLTSFTGNLPSGIITNTVEGNNIVTLDSFTTSFNGDLNIKGDGYGNDNTIIIDTNPNSNDFSIDLVKNINLTSAITTKGDINWTVGETIDFTSNASVTTTSGDVSLTGKQINLSNNTSISSTSGNITLKADTMSLDGGVDTISSSGELLIIQETDGTSIGLGSGSGTLNLTSSEIASFADGFSKISIGNDKTGDVKINNATFTDNLTITGSSIELIGLNANSNNVTLTTTTGNISGNSNVSINDLNLNAKGKIDNLEVDATTLTAIAQTGDLRLKDTSGGLTVNNATADNEGSMSLEAVNGDLNINTVSAKYDISLVAKNGKITDTNGIGVNNLTSLTSQAEALSGIDLDVSSAIRGNGYKTIDTGDIILRRSSGNLDVGGGGIETKNGNVSITITSGNLIVGSPIIAGGIDNTITVDIASGNIQDGNADDNNFTATNINLKTSSTIGSSSDSLETKTTNLIAKTTNSGIFLKNTGDLQSVNIDAGTGNVSLIATGTIADINNITHITATSAKLDSTNGINLNTKITKLSTKASTSGNINIKNTGALTIDTVEGLSGVTATNGQVNLSATDSITINQNINAKDNIQLLGESTFGNGIFIGGSIESETGKITITGKTNNSSAFGINLSTGTSIISESEEISLLGNTINLGNNSIISTIGNIYINSDTDTELGLTQVEATVNITADTLFLNDTVKFNYDIDEENFSTLEVTGKVNLNGSSLQLDLTNVSNTPNIYTLINNDENDDIIGTFDGLAEGDVVGTNGNLTFFITYKGDGDNFDNIGTGNDVQLYSAFTTPIITNGTGQPDIIIGGIGKNIISGGGGNDFVQGGFFDDTLNGGSGNDTLIGGNGNDRLDGGSGNDSLLGGNGDDIILAGSGNDTLIGGSGNDTLTGGSGADLFLFNFANEGIDRITDFNVVDDKIGISASGFGGGLTAGVALTSLQFRSGAGVTTANNATQRFIYNTSTGALFFDVDGVGGNPAEQIAQLNSRLSLSQNNFIVI